MYFKVAPGVRVRVTKHGVRTSLGPRAARVHVGGGYRAGVSTGAGPITLYHGIGGPGRRRPRSTTGGSGGHASATAATVAAHHRQLAAAAKAAEAQQISEALRAISDLHRHPVEAVSPPVAPEGSPVDEWAIRRRHLAEATRGIAFWRRAERAAASRKAAVAAEEEIATARARSDDERRQLQARLDERWAELVANQPDVVLATLREAFEDNELHAAAVAVEGGEASVVVLVPGTDIVPERLPSVTDAGNLSLQKATRSQAAEVYTTAVCGHVLATVRETLAVAPGLAGVRVAAARLGPPDVHGRSRPECLLVSTFSRRALEGVDWEHAEAAAIFDRVAADVHMDMTGRVKHLEPIDLAGEPDLAAMIAAVDVEA